MAKLTKSITINAPVEKVYEYVSDSKNLPEIWPSLIDTQDIKQLPDGKTTDKFTYKMAGIKLEGTTLSEYVKNEKIISKTEGGAKSTQVWTFEPEGAGTKVTFEAEYTIPIPVLGKLAEAIVVKMNEREGDTIMSNLKDRMEA
jgi:ribosome-associated toxin RatA of RatAB toxin-antitoxin module